MKKDSAVPFMRLPDEDLVPDHDEFFVDTGIVPTLREMLFTDPIILKGPKGTGKTLAIEELCAAEGIPRVRQNCNSRTSERDLIGAYSMQGDAPVFVLGSLTTAIEAANSAGACVLILEEINTLPPELHSALFSVADFRQAVEAPSLGKIFRVKPNHSFWIVGTMNPGYAGTYHLNEALRSRFDFAEVGYMDEKNEAQILQNAFSKPPAVEQRRLVTGLLTLAQESRAGEWEYALSTRDLVYLIRRSEQLGKERMLRLMVGKFDPEHREDIFRRVQSTFNVNLNGVDLWSSRTTKS